MTLTAAIVAARARLAVAEAHRPEPEDELDHLGALLEVREGALELVEDCNALGLDPLAVMRQTLGR